MFDLVKLRWWFRCQPSLSLLVGYVGGLLCRLFGYGFVGWFWVVSLSIVVGWLHFGRRFWLCLLFMFLGYYVCGLNLSIGDDSYRHCLDRGSCGVEFIGRVYFHRFWSDSCELSVYSSRGKTCVGRVLLRGVLGKDLSHGDIVKVRGVLTPCGDGGYFSRHYLSLGLRDQVDADEVFVLAGGRFADRLLGYILDYRDEAGKRICEGFRSDVMSGLYKTMVLGMREYFPREEREKFIRSATIHAFSISGLHVSMMMKCLVAFLWVFIWDKRWANVMAMPLVALYILMSGVCPSSLRALLMSGLWALSMFLYRRSNACHVLCLSALILLLLKPLYILNIGFQFSYLMMGVLILGSEMCSMALSILLEKRLWRLRGGLRSKIYGKISEWTTAILSTISVWVGAAGMTLWVNGLVPLGALLVNIPIQWTANMLVKAAFPKLLLSYALPVLSWWLGMFLEFLMMFSSDLAGIAGGGGLCLERARACSVSVFVYIGCVVLLLLQYRRRWVVYLSGGMMMLLGMIWMFGYGVPRERVLTCRSPKGERSTVVLLLDYGRKTYVLKSGCDESVRMASQKLRELGVRKIEGIFTGDDRVSRLSVRCWLRECQVSEVVVFGTDSGWRNWEELALEGMANGIRWFRSGTVEYSLGLGRNVKVDGKLGKFAFKDEAMEFRAETLEGVEGVTYVAYSSPSSSGSLIFEAKSKGIIALR